MSQRVKIEGSNSLFKDKYSGAILNCDKNEYLAAKLKKQNANKLQLMEEEIKELKDTNQQILTLLKSLLERSKT